MRWPKVLALVFCASCICIIGCNRQKTNQDQSQQSGSSKGGGRQGGGTQGRPLPVGVATAQTQDVPVILNGLGTITPYNTVTVRSRVDGQLVRVNFTEGQVVHKGDLLAVVDPRPFQVAVQQAQAAMARDESLLRTSQVNLQRQQTLTSEGVAAQQTLDQQKAETGQYTGTVQLDQAAVDNAKLNLSYTQIQAPLTGRVGLRLVDVGNMVHATDQNGLLVITQMQPISVLFTLPEDQIPQVVSRMKTGSLPVQAYDRDDKTLLASGRLETLDNSIDPTTGTVRLKGVFDNKDSVLWPNQFVNVHLGIQTVKGATVIPSSAIQHGQQNTDFVYVVDGSNTAQMRTIKSQLVQGDIAIIASGVAPGDRVVVDGQDRLQAGMKVDPTTPQSHPQQQNANGGNGSTPPPAPGANPSNSYGGAPRSNGTAGSATLPDANAPANPAGPQGTPAPAPKQPSGKNSGHGRRGGAL